MSESEETLLVEKAIEASIRLTTLTNESSNGEKLNSAVNATSLVVDVGNSDLDGLVLSTVDEAASGGALAGDVELSETVLHL